MVAKQITTCLKAIKNPLPLDRTTLAYVLMCLGIVFLMSAAANSHDVLNAYVCFSSFISFICLMAAFVVVVQNLENETE